MPNFRHTPPGTSTSTLSLKGLLDLICALEEDIAALGPWPRLLVNELALALDEALGGGGRERR